MAVSINWKAVLSHPEAYLDPNDELSSRCLDAVKDLFDFYKSCTDGAGSVCSTGPLAQLYTKGFDNDQIWEEIQLLNDPVLKHLRKTVGRIVSDQEATPQLVHLGEHENDRSDELDVEPASGSDTDSDNEDSEVELMGRHSDDALVNTSHSVLPKKRKAIVDDRFFKLLEMEKFLEMQERETQDHADESAAGDSDEDSVVEVDYFAELSSGDAEVGEGKAAVYNEFFDPPSSEEAEREDGMEKGSKGDGEDGEDGMEEESEDEIQDGIMDVEDSIEDGVHATEKNVNAAVPFGEEQDKSEVAPMSSHEKQQLMMKRRINMLEERNLSQKSWQMDGEVASKGRPLNSLLEEDLDFDHMSRPAPVITEETTRTLEDIIKQRIKDEAWDDVERRIKPVEKPYDYSRSRPLDQDKSKLSLAEVYEQEYVKQTQSLDIDKEDGRHKEIKELMQKLFVRLDALSNFHFTPKPPQPEVKIVANVPAIQMEEVAPVATSDAALLAPEEIQTKPFRTEVGSTEKGTTDRKRERRLKKRQKRLQKAEKVQREKIVAKLRPGLGNKYSKKALTKKLKQRENDEVIDKSLKNSSKFFARLQDEVRDQITSQKDQSSTVKATRSSSAHQFKL